MSYDVCVRCGFPASKHFRIRCWEYEDDSKSVYTAICPTSTLSTVVDSTGGSATDRKNCEDMWVRTVKMLDRIEKAWGEKKKDIL